MVKLQFMEDCCVCLQTYLLHETFVVSLVIMQNWLVTDVIKNLMTKLITQVMTFQGGNFELTAIIGCVLHHTTS